MSPFYVTDGGPYRPELILWLESPAGCILSHTLVDPEGPPVSLGDALRDAMAAPRIGPPRVPTRVRVASEAELLEVRRVLPAVEIVKAPTPELDEFIDAMAQSDDFGAEASMPSYLQGGKISTALTADLFASASLVYQMAPWKVTYDHQVVRLDIPGLGIEGACLSVIGALGETLGLVIFPSYIAYQNFSHAAGSGHRSSGPVDLGSDMLALIYELGADLPPSMLREVAEHGWQVADSRAYPTVQHHDRDGILRPLTEHDVRVVAACTASFGPFFAKHREVFERDTLGDPICESYAGDDDLEVRFTLPYQAGPLFDVNTGGRGELNTASSGTSDKRLRASAPPKVGRNQPCPCGSGRKYKKCCFPKRQSGTGQPEGYQPIHKVDERLIDNLLTNGVENYGSDWLLQARNDFRTPDLAAELVAHWSLFHFMIEKQPLAERLLQDGALRLSSEERGWFDSQRAAWLSIWEVRDVTAGKSILLRDLLTHEERRVAEASASKSLAMRDVLLGRVVDHRGTSVLCGLYLRSLPPDAADVVHQRIRKRLRLKRAVPVDRLRNDKIGRFMIRCWEEELAECDQRAKIPPRLQNTDGDDLLYTIDHFAFDPSRRGDIERILESIVDLEHDDTGAQRSHYTFLRHMKDGPQREVVIGSITLSEGEMRLEANSIARADELRARLESATGAWLTHRVREHRDPIGMMREREREPRPKPRDASPPPSPEECRLLLEFKKQHYADWADHPMPALGGMTARGAVRTKAGREQVSLLIKTMENAEAREPEEVRFDFGPLRRDLGVEE